MSERAHTRQGIEVAAHSFRELARAAARAGSERSDDGAAGRELLAFELGADPYAIPVERVREIVRMRPITPVPRVPSAVRGVVSLRGEIVEVIDLRQRMGMSPAEATRRSRIIVLHGEDGRATALLVDAVIQVLRVSEEGIQPAPGGESPSIEGLCVHDRGFVSLIDLERVLDLDTDD